MAVRVKLKRGHIDPSTGLVFWEYTKAGEYWVKPDVFAMKQSANRAKQQRWRDRHPEQSRANTSGQYAKNPGASADRSARYLERRRSATTADAHAPFIAGFRDIAKRVSSCLGVVFEVDHIRPLSKGGAHHQDNLQVMPAVMNQRKHVGNFRWDDFCSRVDKVRTKKNPASG